jgi:hypothetical protein
MALGKLGCDRSASIAVTNWVSVTTLSCAISSNRPQKASSRQTPVSRPFRAIDRVTTVAFIISAFLPFGETDIVVQNGHRGASRLRVQALSELPTVTCVHRFPKAGHGHHTLSQAKANYVALLEAASDRLSTGTWAAKASLFCSKAAKVDSIIG